MYIMIHKQHKINLKTLTNISSSKEPFVVNIHKSSLHIVCVFVLSVVAIEDL